MAPRVTAEIDIQYALDWSKWPVPEMPPVPDWQGPWNKTISASGVDTNKTAKLAEFNVPIGTGAGGAPWAGSSYGMPISYYNDKGPKTPVWDMSRPVTWHWFTPTFPITHVALPEHVRREGDPLGSSDLHAYLVDPANKVITEMVLVRKHFSNLFQTFFQTEWTTGYGGGGAGIFRWDLTKPYDAAGQPRGGTVAAAVPQLPMVARWEEIQKGNINHCLFGVLPDYGRGFTGWARGSDGTLANHPLKAGDILRLKREKINEYATATPEYVLGMALHTHGLFLGDKNAGNSGGFPLTQDRRWSQGDGKIPKLGSMNLQLTDFEVVVQ